MYDYLTEPLDASDLVSPFRCSDPATESWLGNSALAQQLADLTRTFVMRAPDPHPSLPPVLGYYNLATVSLDAFHKPNRRQPILTPVLNLIRFGVHADVERRGIGQHLLLDALTRAVELADTAGCMGIIASAPSEYAKHWLAQRGFNELGTGVPTNMLLPMRMARRVVRAASGG